MLTVPKQISIYHREGEPAVKVRTRNGSSYFMSGLENQYRIDRKTNEKRPTTKQAAFDIGVQCYTALLSDCNLVNFSGYLKTAMSSSIEVLVFIDEILDYLLIITNGVEINEDSLAEEVIKEVGPNGNFLMEEHTMEHFKENWMPKNIIRTSYEKWSDAGSKDLNERNKEIVEKIVEADSRKPLKPEILEKLDQIVKNAEAAIQ